MSTELDIAIKMQVIEEAQKVIGIEINDATQMVGGAPNKTDAFVIISKPQTKHEEHDFMLDETWWNTHLEVTFGLSTSLWKYWLNTVSVIEDDESFIIHFWIY